MSNLQDQVKSIVETIENGIIITDENIDDDGFYRVGDMLSGFDYITDCLDFEFTITSDKQYKGARILVTFGGPNIWIDTIKKEVQGFWWDESFTMPYFKDSFDLNECMEEIFHC